MKRATRREFIHASGAPFVAVGVARALGAQRVEPGSGVAAATCFAAFTMGTDTSGSIRIPSSHNSLVGLRPSAGLSSRSGITPFGHTQDTGGPMARSVEDIALILDETVGYDPDDPTTQASSGRIPRSYSTSLKEGSLKGARVGVAHPRLSARANLVLPAV